MRKLKPILSLVLALAMIFSCFTAIAADGDGEEEQEIVTRFSDVDPSSTLGKAVTDLAMLGIITGYPDGTFGPEGNITRAEFATICVRLAKLSEGLPDDAVTGFVDVDSEDEANKWARPYIYMAKSRGIINGYDDGTFKSGKTVSYAEAVKMLMCLHGWGPICEGDIAGNPNARWYDGYIKYANQQKLTQNVMSGVSAPDNAVNRGTVAILAYNSYSLQDVVEGTNEETGETVWQVGGGSTSGGSKDKDSTSDLDTQIVRGVVTATFLAYIDEPRRDLNKNEIMVGSTIYELRSNVRDSIDYYDILGKTVSMRYDEDEDYITKIEVTDDDPVNIYSGCVDGEKFFLGVEGGKICYTSNPDTFRETLISLPNTVIFNGKLVEDFYADDLMDPDSPYYFTNGVIQVYDSGKYHFAKITNYETRVVKSTSSSRGKETINFMYLTGDDYKMDFPTSSDADYFVFRRGNTAIESRSGLKQFDVLNIIRSPEDADGDSVLIIDVSRNSLTKQTVNSINDNDETIIKVGGKYYQYNYAYQNVPEDSTDEAPELSRGSTANLYFDKIGLIAAVSSSGTDSSAYKYGYLLSLRQNDRESDYDLEFYMIDLSGSSVSEVEVGAAQNIQIDGKKYASDNDDILDALRDSAIDANRSYRNVGGGDELENVTYQQPIRFKQNSSKLITAIDTVSSSNVGDDLELSASIDDGSADSEGRRTYNKSSGFQYVNADGDDAYFQVSSDTKILFVPDDRSSYDDYNRMSYGNFVSGNKYYVEAFNIGTTRSNRPDLVLVYKANDSQIFNHTTPFLIVTDYGVGDDDVEYITGYRGSYSGGVSTSTTTVKVNYNKLPSSARDDFENLGRGDIVRYLSSGSGSEARVIDLDMWLDASDPVQEESVANIGEAMANRILAIRSNSPDPVSGDAYNAAFRLAYGTVIRHESDIKTLTVAPTLDVDFDDNDFEMVQGGSGVVAHMYGSNTKVFVYNDSRKGAEYISGEDAFSEISSFEEAEYGASVVVTFSTGDTTSSASPFRMVYIIR